MTTIKNMFNYLRIMNFKFLTNSPMYFLIIFKNWLEQGLLFFILGVSLMFLTSCSKDESLSIQDNTQDIDTIDNSNTNLIKDVEGNIYTTVKIGNQIWMGENLRTKKYNDGTNIPLVTEMLAWHDLSTGAFSYYENDTANLLEYGGLYNWYAIETNKLCPIGWHVPTIEEWRVLEDFLTLNGYDGNALKDVSGWSDTGAVSGNGTDDFGFKGVPGGHRWNYGNYKYSGSFSHWWSSTELPKEEEYYQNHAWQCYLSNYRSDLTLERMGIKRNGYSVRCIKD